MRWSPSAAGWSPSAGGLDRRSGRGSKDEAHHLQPARATTNSENSDTGTPLRDHKQLPVTSSSKSMSKTAQQMDRSSLLPFTGTGAVIEDRAGGLCNCFSDWNSCLWGYCCPCYLFGRTAQRAGIIGSTWTGCLMYFVLGAVIPNLIAISIVLHFSESLGGYDDCVRNHRSPPDGSQSADGSAALGALHGGGDPSCDSILVHALALLYRNLLLFDLLLFATFGALCGYYRQKIYAVLGGAGSSWKNVLVHCLPCTHFCAMCQEARAVDTANQPYRGLQV